MQVVERCGVRCKPEDQLQFAEDPPPLPSPPPPAVQGNATPEVAAMYTAEQLQEAILSGVRDIEIRAHLDLRNLTQVDTPEVLSNFSHFQYVLATTRSIRVCNLQYPAQTCVHSFQIRVIMTTLQIQSNA